MLNPISQSSHSAASASTTPDITDMAHKMQKLLQHFSQSLEAVLKDPSQAGQKPFQRDFADMISHLHDSVKKANDI